jgi:transposase
MTEISKHGSISKAAMKADMDEKTARKYAKEVVSPKEKMDTTRTHRTRQDPLWQHWDEISERLTEHPGLEAKSLLSLLMEEHPNQYNERHLRTLQRRVKEWQMTHGADKDVIFRQKLYPAKQSQSDWTHMKSLHITISGIPFDHLLFHFILPYSRFETAMICGVESFDTLTRGFENASITIGGVCLEHRTDNLSAATQKMGCSRVFTNRWQQFMNHYGVTPSRNNPGESHENGSVEKSHDLLKKAIDQALMLRRSRDFKDLTEYNGFLQTLIRKRNSMRLVKFQEEQELLRPLPETGFNEAIMLKCRVTPCSTLSVLSVIYSVPSRFIGTWMTVYVYRDHIELFYNGRLCETLPRVFSGIVINYRHIIDSLVRKPKAFENYQHQASLFPSPVFRKAYDWLKENDNKPSKTYLSILQLAKREGEEDVKLALELLLDEAKVLSANEVLSLIEKSRTSEIKGEVMPVSLAVYDTLHHFKGVA